MDPLSLLRENHGTLVIIHRIYAASKYEKMISDYTPDYTWDIIHFQLVPSLNAGKVVFWWDVHKWRGIFIGLSRYLPFLWECVGLPLSGYQSPLRTGTVMQMSPLRVDIID